MSSPAIVRLPFFIKPLKRIKKREVWDIPYIWPGFSDKVIHEKKFANHKFWNPAWIFSSEVADKILFEYRSLKTCDLEVMLSQATHQANKKILDKPNLSYAEELAITQFERNGDADSIFADYSLKKQEIKEEAQKLLILFWHLQELQQDIEEILEACDYQSRNLFQSFKEPLQESEELITDLAEIEKSAKGTQLITPFNFLSDLWKVCLANILLFLPKETAIFAEGEMAFALASLLDFNPVNNNIYGTDKSIGSTGYELLEARAKPLDILQRTIFSRLKYFPQEYLIERTWLILDSENL